MEHHSTKHSETQWERATMSNIRVRISFTNSSHGTNKAIHEWIAHPWHREIYSPSNLLHSYSLVQIDSNEGDLTDERALEHRFSGDEDDTLQASMIALHGSTCSADMDYQTTLQSSTPKVGQQTCTVVSWVNFKAITVSNFKKACYNAKTVSVPCHLFEFHWSKLLPFSLRKLLA